MHATHGCVDQQAEAYNMSDETRAWLLRPRMRKKKMCHKTFVWSFSVVALPEADLRTDPKHTHIVEARRGFQYRFYSPRLCEGGVSSGFFD